MTRSRRIVRGLALSFGVLVALALAAELTLRWQGFAPLEGARSEPTWSVLRASEDTLLAYELIPGATGRAFECDVRVNALGFRGPETSSGPVAGTRRIVVLGDSITFGNHLAEADTYCAVAQGTLEAQGHKVELLNLGLTGYDTLQEARCLEVRGLALKPELVVVGYCFNDAGTVSVELDQLERLQRYEHPLFTLRSAQWLALRLERARALRGVQELNEDTNFARLHVGTIDAVAADAELAASVKLVRERLAERDVPPPAWSPLAWYASDVHVGHLAHGMSELGRVARSGAVPVLVVLLPSLKEKPHLAAHEAAYALVEGLARRQGFDVLDLTQELRASDVDLRVLPKDFIHFNAEGQRRIGAALARELLARGYLER